MPATTIRVHAPMSDHPLYLGIDIGGSSIKVGVVNDLGRPLSHRQVPSALDQGLEMGMTNLYATIESVLDDANLTLADIDAVGVAAPGTIDIPAGVIHHPFNLPGWENLPLRQMVEKKLGKPTVLQNDANAAAFGEFWVGAASEARSLLFWTLGTGIGAGLVMNGEIIEGAHSHAGECGHMIIQMEGGPRSPHNIHGSLELYASSLALIRRCHEALDAGRCSSLVETRRQNGRIDAKCIADAAEEGDELAEELILETAEYLAIGTMNIMHILNPAMVLLGGAMTFGQRETTIGRRFVDHFIAQVRSRAFPIPGSQTVFDYASLGPTAGFIGAAGCAKAHLEALRHPRPNAFRAATG